MKKLFHEFFHIPKDGTIQDKVMLTRVVMSIATVMLCLVAMSATAYAYFAYNITSDYNMIQAATFKADISVTITDANNKAVDAKVITSNYQTHRVEGLEVGKYYTVTIVPTKQSTAKTRVITA